VPDATPEQVDAWMREGSFRPASRKPQNRIPAAVVGRDPQYAGNVAVDEYGTPFNALDTPEVAQLRADALNEASSFVQAERASGNVKANEAATRERIDMMTPEQLRIYMEQDPEERKMFAMAAPVDYGTGAANLWHYH
jgi:hypothetical protein